MKFATSFWVSKVTYTGLLAIATAIVGALNHQITWPQAVAAIFAALQSIFIRDTLAKSVEAAHPLG